ncbi:MAG: preprotein translocase subunit SecE [Gemmatimonadota bacterium]|nr:preprotein translocase subunit SecE [Gemmatimonadota bacterium]
MSRITGAKVFLQECVTEMERVTWPDREQLRNATWVVILFTILLTLVIWLMDFVSSLILVDFIMGIFS